MKKSRAARWCVCLAALTITLAGRADDEPPKPVRSGNPPPRHGGTVWAPPVPVLRSDFARVLGRFEQEWAKATLTAQQRRTVSRSMDQPTFQAARGGFAFGIRQVNMLATLLHPETPATPSQEFAASLKLSSKFAIHDLRSGFEGEVRISSMYPFTVRTGDTIHVMLEAADAQGRVVLTTPLPAADPTSGVLDCIVTMAIQPAPKEPATYAITLVADGRRFPLGDYVVDDRTVFDRKSSFDRRLAAVTPSTPALSRAVDIFRSRLDLLVDRPTDQQTSQRVLQPLALSAELHEDLTAIESGRDPYAKRSGDWWCAPMLQGQPLPMRWFVPQGEPDRPRPLLIAFNAFIGDEHTFLDIYAAGALADLAAKHSVIVLCPSAERLQQNPDAFRELIEFAVSLYPVDRSRILFLGHSQGGRLASDLLRVNPGTVAAAAILGATVQAAKDDRLPPMLLVGAEEDTLVRLREVRASAESLTLDGHSVTFREIPDAGHLMMVGDALPEAVQWLLEQPPLNAPAPSASSPAASAPANP